MQGLPHETDQGSGKNMVPSGVDKRSGKRSMRRKVSTIAESGTCNVCSAPCSSCMHLKLARMGTKGGEMSDETSHLAATSQNSINDNQQHAASETSNLLSVNSNHDTSSENAESKVVIRSSEVADASIESKMLPKLIPGVTVGGDQLFPEDSKPVEGLDDNISCVSRANDGSTVVSYSRKNADKKNLLRNSDPVCGLVQEGCEEAVSGAVSQEKSANRSSDLLVSAKSGIDKDASIICAKLEAEDKDSGDQPDVVVNCIKNVGVEKKSNELPDTEEPALQSVSENDSDESEIMEHDVKVCDICGDAGREDLLAICSQCTDGAEHTYCMREMLQKVPEGDWLCEECKMTEELAKQKQSSDAEEKTVRKENCQSSGKRHIETTEVISSSKRQAIETSSGSPKSSSSGRTPVLSRESSFKSLDKGKVRSTQQSSSGNQSSADLPETARISAVSRLQNQRGVLSKSSSFSTQNSKPKARLADEFPQKFRGSRESSSLETKEEPPKVLSKSMSFKSVNSGRPNASEPKVKMLPFQVPHAPEKKGFKPMTERNAFDRKSLSRMDRPQGSSIGKVDQKLTPRGDAGMRLSMDNSKEVKASHLSGKVGNLSRSNSFVSRKGPELQVTSAQAPAQASAGNDVNASVDSKACLVSPKEEAASSPSWIPGRSSINDSENLPESSPRLRDPSVKGEKPKESSVNRLKPSSAISPRNVTCQKCKEVGHAAENCTKSGRVEMSGNKLKAAIEAAMLKKPGIYRKKREIEQPDGLSSSNTDGSRFSALSKIKELNADEEKAEGQTNLQIPFSESCKQSSTHNLKHLNGSAVDASFPDKVEDSDSAVHSVGKSNLALVPPCIVMQTLAIPEHEYIWQGAFEVCKGGRYFEWYGGIQAHLSTCASPKVLEVAKRFPQKLTLDEVPRSCTWPRQFHINGAKEDNIAVFFFAKDVESFEKHYMGLLDNMIRKDLALKGSIDGVDLLIFPSAQLPESSQRWNMLFFLWGVFRGRKSKCSESLKSDASNLDAVSQEIEKMAVVMSVHDDSCLAEAADKETFGKISLKECKSDVAIVSSAQTSGTNRVAVGQVEDQTKPDASPNSGNLLSSKVSGSGDQDSSDRGSQNAAIGSHGLTVKVERDLNEDIENMDSESPSERNQNTQGIENWHGNSRKRQYFDLSKEVPQTYTGSTDKMQLDRVAGILTESESVSKKSKIGFSEIYGSSSSGDEISLKDRLVSQVCDLATSSSSEEKHFGEAYDDKVIQPKFGSTERFFFPIDLENAKDPRSGANLMPWKDCTSGSGENSQFRGGVPNLELALGAETKSANKGMLPFLVGMPEKNSNHSRPSEKIIEKEEEDSVSASLSLSLSFPFPEKEQSAIPETKAQQHVPEKRGVNKSWFLYGGLSDE